MQLRSLVSFLSGRFATREDCMTAWLSNSDLSDQTQRARWNTIAVLYVAVAVVAAIGLLFIVSHNHPIPPDAAAYLIGP
jgi:hypothetical protein